jgi:hypothetical protein
MIINLPPGKHSTKGCVITTPDPTILHRTADGAELAFGKGVNSRIGKSDLLYNEYIVYNEAQIRMKYLIMVEFDYNYD